jgi:hypothetical protein
LARCVRGTAWEPTHIGGPMLKTILLIIVVVLVVLFLVGKFRPGRK